jgi:tetratricopeptide (TPR) repeat protein
MYNKKNLVFHPFLFALYPSLFFYNLNKHDLWFKDIILPTVVTLISTCLLLALFAYILKKVAKAGIFVSFFIILFFFYEAILNQFSRNAFGELLLSQDPALFWSYGAFLILLFTGIKIRETNFFTFTRFLNIVSLTLIIFPIASIGLYKFQSQLINIEKPNTLEETPIHSKMPDPKPDIYYIIVDSYTNGENLKHFWQYDNKEFLSYLKQKGFYVVPKGRSNYQHTGYSLPSSLNMQHVHDLAKYEDGALVTPHLSKMWSQNKVARFLKSIGYKYIIVGDWLRSDFEDIHFTFRATISRYSEYFINKTWLKSLELKSFDPIQKGRENTLHNFKWLGEIPKNKKPTFTYAHIMIPHPPFVFDRDGNLPKEENLNSPSIVYPDQIAFTNKKLIDFIENVLSKSKTKPIIIIQADHGFEVSTGIKPDEKDHRRVFGILNAYYLPQNGNQILYKTITPVNSFRLIFNHYFGTNLKILPDKSYFRFNFSDSWSFISIPDHPDSIKNQTSLEEANSKWIESLEGYVRNTPGFYDSRVVLGWNYHLINQDSKAIEQLNKAVEINPKIAAAHYLLGSIFNNLNQLKKAKKSFLKSIEYKKYFKSDVLFLIGKINFELKQFDGALKYLKEASKYKNSTSAEVYNYIAMAFHKKKDLDSAEKHWKLAIAENPNFFQYYRSLANLYFDKELYKKSLVEYKKAIEFNPNQPRVFVIMGLAYAKLNKLEQASEMFLKTLKIEPNNEIALSGLNFIKTFNKT